MAWTESFSPPIVDNSTKSLCMTNYSSLIHSMEGKGTIYFKIVAHVEQYLKT